MQSRHLVVVLDVGVVLVGREMGSHVRDAVRASSHTGFLTLPDPAQPRLILSSSWTWHR